MSRTWVHVVRAETPFESKKTRPLTLGPPPGFEHVRPGKRDLKIKCRPEFRDAIVDALKALEVQYDIKYGETNLYIYVCMDNCSKIQFSRNLREHDLWVRVYGINLEVLSK